MHDRIKRFVRNTLGCNCPDEVFSSVEHTPGYGLKCGTVLRDRIGIRGRLLVYVLEADFPAANGLLPGVIKDGVEDRDRGGFSRLRVVIAARDKGAAEGETSSVSRFELLDGRVHLHIIGAGELF
jgi:hypothetical protein